MEQNLQRGVGGKIGVALAVFRPSSASGSNRRNISTAAVNSGSLSEFSSDVRAPMTIWH